MASSSFRSCHFRYSCDLKVTFLNDSVSRSKRPLTDFPEGDQSLQPDLKRQCYSAPCLPQKTSLLPSIISSSSSGVAASQIYSLTSTGYRDDSELDATLLEPSDGEEPDSSSDLSPEDEDRLLEDDPDDKPKIFARHVAFGQNADQVESSYFPVSSLIVQLQSTPRTLEETVSIEPLPPTGPSGSFSCGLACRNDPVNSEWGSDLNTGFQNQTGLSLNLKSPELPEAVSVEAASVSLENGGDGCGVAFEEAAQAVSDDPGSAVESTSVVAEGPSEEQASVGQSEVAGDSASNVPNETKGEANSASLLEEAATSSSNSAGDQSGDRVANPGDQSGDRVANPGAGEPNRPRPASKICIQEADLELHKRNYVNAVRAHVAFDNGQLVGATNELYALMGRVASEFRSQEPGFVHPTDLTMRNYAERTNQPTKRYTLSQWVERNQRNHRRFEDPQFLHFKRSPIPGL